MAQGSCLKARGQEKIWRWVPQARAQRQIFPGHEPWAASLEAWAMSHEPLTTDNRLKNELFNSKFQNFKYHDPSGRYPDLLEKPKIPENKFTTSVTHRPTIQTILLKICLFEPVPTQMSFIRTVRLDKKIMGTFLTPHNYYRLGSISLDRELAVRKRPSVKSLETK